MSEPVRLGVLGWPVAHSRSPAMHNAALAELGLADWRYQHLPVPPERFTETVPTASAISWTAPRSITSCCSGARGSCCPISPQCTT